MKIATRSRICFCLAFCLKAPLTQAGTVQVGALSYDIFIPASGGSLGVDAFNLSNLTGGFSLPPDFPVSDALTFRNASLTLTPSGQSPTVFNLGDIGPGFLLDTGGNPIVQVPGGQTFTSAEFVAMLFPTAFLLNGGSTFVAGSASMDVLLLPSSGQTLMPDIDQTTIGVSSVPEPASGALLLAGLLCFAFRLGHFRQTGLPERA